MKQINQFYSDATVSRTNVWHLRADGNDSNDGKTYANAKATLANLLAAITDKTNQTILMWEGEWYITTAISVNAPSFSLCGIGPKASMLYIGSGGSLKFFGSNFTMDNCGVTRENTVSEEYGELLFLRGSGISLTSLYLEQKSIVSNPAIAFIADAIGLDIDGIEVKGQGPVLSVGNIADSHISNIRSLNTLSTAAMPINLIDIAKMTNTSISNIYNVSAYSREGVESLISISGNLAGNNVIKNIYNENVQAIPENGEFRILTLGGASGDLALSGINIKRPNLSGGDAYDIVLSEGNDITLSITNSDIDITKCVNLVSNNVRGAIASNISGQIDVGSILGESPFTGIADELAYRGIGTNVMVKPKEA